MLNQERLYKVLVDMQESVAYLDECTELLRVAEEGKTKMFMTFGLKQLFVDFFITVEDFTSMMLKELKAFKIGIDMRESIQILHKETIVDEDLFRFLNQARLLRNRISHRYKEPSNEELIAFIEENKSYFKQAIKVVSGYIVI